MDLDFANVLPSVPNIIIIGLSASIFIALAKWFTNRYSVPYLGPFFAGL